MSKYTSINILHLARENFSPGEYFQLYSIMPFQMCVCVGGGGGGGGRGGIQSKIYTS